MAIEKLLEFAKDGQKNTDDLNLTDGFPVSKKPARQWFNWLFNSLTSKVNEIIDAEFIPKAEIVDNLTTNDATKPVSAKQVKLLQENKLDKSALNNTLTSTSITQALTAAQGKVLNDQAFGVGQTWQIASLVKGTTYTNTTGKLIVVFAYFTRTTANYLATLFCDDEIIDYLEIHGTGGATNTIKTISLRGEIPPGSEYRFEVDNSSVNIIYSRILS